MAQFSVKNSLKTETKGLALKEQWCDKMSYTIPQTKQYTYYYFA